MGKKNKFFGEEIDDDFVDRKELTSTPGEAISTETFDNSFSYRTDTDLESGYLSETTLQTKTDEQTKHDDELDEKIDKIKEKIDENKEVVNQNIEAAIARGENLDQLSVQTEELSDSSKTFSNKSKEVQRKMWWKKARCWIFLGAFVFIVILIGIVLFVFL